MEKKKFLVIVGMLISISAVGITAWSSTTFAEEALIPNWIRNTALWYGEGKINDGDFINALQWLMNEEILKIPSPDSDSEKIVENEINFDKISLEVTGIHELARMLDVAQALSVSNNDFSAMPDVLSVIEQRENEWTTTDWEDITPFMHELIENNLSDLLREYANNYPSSIGVEFDMYPEIILTNSFGVNIAQTGKTTDYLQSDELWWIRAKADLLYISEIHYDQSVDVYSVDIGYRVNDSNGRFLGVIKAVTNVNQFYIQ